MRYLKSEDWKDFEKAHPSAMAFLRERMIINEYSFLNARKSDGTITQWEANRLNELNIIFGEG